METKVLYKSFEPETIKVDRIRICEPDPIDAKVFFKNSVIGEYCDGTPIYDNEVDHFEVVLTYDDAANINRAVDMLRNGVPFSGLPENYQALLNDLSEIVFTDKE